MMPQTPSKMAAKSHPLEPEISRKVDDYFLEHWPFTNEKARMKFVAAGFPRVTCLYFPLARDDRIEFAALLLTILFLVDGKW
jgi:aristolochene synthase